MKSVGKMSPEELATHVCQSLADAGIRVTLTGGACVAIWSNGRYQSRDLDFVEQGTVPRREVRAVMKRLGFTERGRHFEHSDTDFIVEFPTGPLAVGDEPVSRIAERRSAAGTLRLLSPTDCVKDRLAAYFHWDDRQALEQALLVARAQPVDLAEIRRWAGTEGELGRFETFRQRLEAADSAS